MAAHNRDLVLTDEFRHALDLLAGGRHVFLTGKAGTGKSTLIRLFMAGTDRNVVVVAATGIAVEGGLQRVASVTVMQELFSMA